MHSQWTQAKTVERNRAAANYTQCGAVYTKLKPNVGKRGACGRRARSTRSSHPGVGAEEKGTDLRLTGRLSGSHNFMVCIFLMSEILGSLLSEIQAGYSYAETALRNIQKKGQPVAEGS